jgi:hypothetical protein
MTDRSDLGARLARDHRRLADGTRRAAPRSVARVRSTRRRRWLLAVVVVGMLVDVAAVRVLIEATIDGPALWRWVAIPAAALVAPAVLALLVNDRD